MMRIARWATPLEMVQFLKTIAEAEAAFEGIRPQAMNVAPDDAKNIEDRLFAAKADADRGFYARATLECHRVREQILAMTSTLPGREAELETRWIRLSEALPGVLASIDRKRTGRRMTGMSRRWLDAVAEECEAIRAAWDHAQSAARSGRWHEAVSRGDEAGRRAASLAEELRGF